MRGWDSSPTPNPLAAQGPELQVDRLTANLPGQDPENIYRQFNISALQFFVLFSMNQHPSDLVGHVAAVEGVTLDPELHVVKVDDVQQVGQSELSGVSEDKL